MNKPRNIKGGNSFVKTSQKSHRSQGEGGFTIMEVVISVGIMVVFLPYAASMLVNSQLLAGYSKHKIEAAYAARQIIETQRQNAFLTIAAGNSVTIQPSPSSVLLDTKGSYANPTCANTNNFCGTATVVVTPAVYTSTTGVKTTSTTVDHFVVTINWNEQILKVKVPMTETYAEDIANDPMLN